MNQTSVKDVLARFPGAGRDSLIPILQKVQEADGFLSQEAMEAIGTHLGLPASKVYGVATFYNQFRFQPQGKHHCQVCRGTACHVKGSGKVLDALQKQLNIKAGQTTRDGNFSLEVVACIGACGLAPVITMNGEFHASVTPDSVSKILKQCETGDPS
jgi:NADH-quinone oxidoreductase subunit E